MSAALKKRSPVWEYFVEGSDENKHKAKCKECDVYVPRGGIIPSNYTTTNLINHIKRFHSQSHEALLSKMLAQNTKAKEKKTTASNQPTITASFEAQKPWGASHPQTRKFNHIIAKLIAIDSQPFSVVEDAGFKELMKEAVPKYTLPGNFNIL